MGINEREYMRRPIPPSANVVVVQEARPESRLETRDDRPRKWTLLRACARETAVLIGLMVIIRAIGIGQMWLWQHSFWPQLARTAVCLAILIVAVFLCVGFARRYRSIFALPLDLLGGLIQAGSLTGLVVVGATWLGADFSTLLEAGLHRPAAIAKLTTIVEQTPWWYLLFCCVTAASSTRLADQKSLHWRFGGGFTLVISGAMFVGKVLMDTGLYREFF